MAFINNCVADILFFQYSQPLRKREKSAFYPCKICLCCQCARYDHQVQTTIERRFV